MQTVNFNCPHCGNLMAVGAALLGRNVRCPHCKQVTRAPANAGQTPMAPVPTPPVPTFQIQQPLEHHESIFGERHDEDVFGSEPPRPTMILPEQPAPPPIPSHLDETAPIPPVEPEPPEDLLRFDDAPAPPPPESEAFEPESTALDRPRPSDREPAEPRRITAREAAPPTQAFAWIMLAYALVATALAGFFGFHYFTAGASGDHPFRAIPDFYGQYEKSTRKQLSFQGMPDPKLDVPADLRVKLGETLVIGDLQVQPVAVEKQKLMAVTVPEVGDPTDPRGTGKATLVMTLRVKNLSTDTVLYPNDPAFNRAKEKGKPDPYTALELKRKFFHGTFKWPPDEGTRKEYIHGHEADEQPLNPGEERETWVTVAPWGVRVATEDVIDALEQLKPDDHLLWRVQLRRGLMKVPGESGGEVEMSVTSVIGVDFLASQIK